MSMNEFIGIDLDAIGHQVDERAGDLHIWFRGVLLARYPWHTHAHPDELGNLHIFDLTKQRWIRRFEAGSYTTVNRAPAPER